MEALPDLQARLLGAHAQGAQAGPIATGLVDRMESMENREQLWNYIVRSHAAGVECSVLAEASEYENVRKSAQCHLAREGANHLSRSPAEVEIITKGEPEFFKYVLERIDTWPRTTLAGVIKARRDYAVASAVYGAVKAKRIFDEVDTEAIALMSRMAVINEQERVLREAEAPEAGTRKPANASDTASQAMECFNCRGIHFARDCPRPYYKANRAARKVPRRCRPVDRDDRGGTAEGSGRCYIHRRA